MEKPKKKYNIIALATALCLLFLCTGFMYGTNRNLRVSAAVFSSETVVPEIIFSDKYINISADSAIAAYGNNLSVFAVKGFGVLGVDSYGVQHGFYRTADSIDDILIFDNLLFLLDGRTNTLTALDSARIDQQGQYSLISSLSLNGAASGTALAVSIVSENGAVRLYAAFTGQLCVWDVDISRSTVLGVTSVSVSLRNASVTASYNLQNITKIRTTYSGGVTTAAILCQARFGGKTIVSYYINGANISSKDIFGADGEQISDFILQDNEIYVCLTDTRFLSVDSTNRLIWAENYNSSKSVATGRIFAPFAIVRDGNGCMVFDSFRGKVAAQKFVLSGGSLSFEKNIFTAGDSELNKFASPKVVSVGQDCIYFADYALNRVSYKYRTSDEFFKLDYNFVRPTHMEITSDGVLIVVDNRSRITAWDAQHKLIAEVGSFSEIADIALTSDNTLYVSDTSRGVLYSQNYVDYTLLSDTRVAKLAANSHADAVFCLTHDGEFFSLSKNGAKTDYAFETGPANDIEDIAIDHSKNLYCLSGSALTRFTFSADNNSYTDIKIFNLDCGDFATDYDAFTSLHISLAENSGIGYGDIVLTDSGGASIRKIDAASAGVVVFDYSAVPPPVDIISPVPNANLSGIQVRNIVAAGAMIYQFPSTRYPVASLNTDAQALVISYNIDSSEFFSYCMVEFDRNIEIDGRQTKLVSGYILKSYLSAAKPNTSYAYKSARVLNANTGVFKYPFLGAAKLTVQGSEYKLDKNDTVSLVEFAYRFYDLGGTEWVAIAVPGGVGFVPSSNLIGDIYTSTALNVRYNATIKTLSETGINVFILSGNTYNVVENIYIPTETRVYAYDYDSKQEYIKISYVNDYGTIECYVESKYITPDDLSSGQVWALIILIVVIAAAAILFGFYARSKRNGNYQH